MLREDLQRNVFVDDSRHQVAQLIQLVNVPGVHQDAIGQSARLVATGLVSLIEQRAHLRVFGEHHVIEVCHQRLATTFEQRHSGLNDGTVLSSKHKVDS